jgi:hypothetical protein
MSSYASRTVVESRRETSWAHRGGEILHVTWLSCPSPPQENASTGHFFRPARERFSVSRLCDSARVLPGRFGGIGRSPDQRDPLAVRPASGGARPVQPRRDLRWPRWLSPFLGSRPLTLRPMMPRSEMAPLWPGIGSPTSTAPTAESPSPTPATAAVVRSPWPSAITATSCSTRPTSSDRGRDDERHRAPERGTGQARLVPRRRPERFVRLAPQNRRQPPCLRRGPWAQAARRFEGQVNILESCTRPLSCLPRAGRGGGPSSPGRPVNPTALPLPLEMKKMPGA